MKIFGIDSSTNAASIAIIEDEKLICEYTVNTKKTQSQKLMPMIEDMIKESELNINDIDLMTICVGPGSFTGLRIGMSTVKAFAHINNTPIIAVNSLESLAFNISLCEKTICAILDAQRNQVYTAQYKFEDGILKTIENVSVKTIDDLLEELSVKNEDIIVVGEASLLYKEKISQVKNIKLAPSSNNVSKASSLCSLAMQKYEGNKDIYNFHEIKPMYIRKSQAEVQYDEKMKRIQNDK